MNRGRRVALVCGRCSEIFTRRLVDAVRSPVTLCGVECRNAEARTGRAVRVVPCAGCGVTFSKLLTEVRKAEARGGRHYCTQACYLAHVDRSKLGAIGGRSSKWVDPAVARERSRKGGLERARRLSPEQLRAIAMAGVRARTEKMSAQDRSMVSRRASMTRRFGAAVVFGVRLGKERS